MCDQDSDKEFSLEYVNMPSLVSFWVLWLDCELGELGDSVFVEVELLVHHLVIGLAVKVLLQLLQIALDVKNAVFASKCANVNAFNRLHAKFSRKIRLAVEE